MALNTVSVNTITFTNNTVKQMIKRLVIFEQLLK